MNNKDIVLVSLVGLPRSGTTVASEFLSANGYFNLGEMQSLVTRSMNRGGKCQCGETVFNCAFWAGVIAEISEGDIRALTWVRSHLLLTASTIFFRIRTNKVGKALEALRNLYSLAMASSNGRILIDTSKNPMWHFVVHEALESNTYFISWNRDALSVINSFTSRGQSYHPLYLLTYSMLRKALLIRRKKKIRQQYDRFVQAPGLFLKTVDDFCEYHKYTADGERDYAMNSFIRNSGHSIAGNPSRTSKGEIKIAFSPAPVGLSLSRRIFAKVLNTFQ